MLKIRKADKQRIIRPYLQHIHTLAYEFDQRKRELKLYMNLEIQNCDQNRSGRWRLISFTHPSTFEMIAMKVDLKSKVKSDGI